MHATESLIAEHQTILRALTCLEALVTSPEWREEPRQTFVEVVDFLRTYADRLHHGKEEALLFPAMEQRGMPAHQGPTAAMRYEHEAGRALVRRMAAAIEPEQIDHAELRSAGLGFVGLLRSHIAKENHILFPMAERLLGGGELREVALAYEQVEARDFPADIHARYEGWARELATRLDVDREVFEVHPTCH